MRVATYARYSSDNQRQVSIEDQQRGNRELAKRLKGGIVKGCEFADAALSGSSAITRPSYQALLDAARKKHFDVVVAESLDRLSRDQEDTAGLYKRLTFYGIKIITQTEGEITDTHVAIRGLTNSQYIKDNAFKTKRGMHGRVLIGKAAGGVSFGYRDVKTIIDGVATTGERAIDPVQAKIIQRIFKLYLGGLSCKAVAKLLNSEKIPSPRGSSWKPSTINGDVELGTGILHNELYVGRLVWNRQRWAKHPDTGKRLSFPNPKSEWVITEVPELRIISDDDWTAVQARSAARKKAFKKAAGNFNALRRPTYLLSGLTKCGVCGAGYTLHSNGLLSCFGNRSCGSCTNDLTITRQDVEHRVLAALQKLMHKGRFEKFCQAYTKELNRQHMEARAAVSGGKKELEKVERELQKLIQAIIDGVPGLTLKDRIQVLEDRKAELMHLLATDEPVPLIHPTMADRYQAKLRELLAALESNDTEVRQAAGEAVRLLINAIILTPNKGALRIDLQGQLAEILALGQSRTSRAKASDYAREVQNIAGGGFVLDFTAVSAA
jgi:DNA invertase Pin-like site-specific DNA recombinase